MQIKNELRRAGQTPWRILQKTCIGLTALVVVAVWLVAPFIGQEAEQRRKGAGVSVTGGPLVHSLNSGLCAGALLSDDTGPIAWFGLVKSRHQDTRFSYLILLRPTDQTEKTSVHYKKSRVFEGGTGATVDAHMVLKLGEGQFETRWSFESNAEGILRDALVLGNRTVPPDETRIYLLDASGDAPKCRPVATDVKIKAPDVRMDKGDWEPAVRAAIKTLKENSPEVAHFLGKAK